MLSALPLSHTRQTSRSGIGLKLELKVSDEELAARKAKWQPREPKVTTGYLKRYASMVTSGNRGAILKTPEA